MPNRLAAATSPYLLQHADNPVDWYEWGHEALERAREEDKPILLSIGYSACHWCHVMAHESFENAAIAEQMNRDFVNIKVDREERPDLDAVYMEAVQAMTGHGGWPMTVFLTPDGEPFYGGTYFPPTTRGNAAGFPQVLEAVAEAWRERRGEIEQRADRLVDALRDAGRPAAADALSDALIGAATASLLGQADRTDGGFGGAPKFPQTSSLRFLLGRHVRTGDDAPLDVVTKTLDAMLRGGIYDHLGGGFHRYSVDRQWTVPHFEKMLYDNALLSRLYVHAWQVTGERRYRRVAEETFDYLLREMRSQDGGFYATQDADTSGGEGAFFTWTPAQVDAVLDEELAAVAKRWYGITPGGNFDGTTVLTARRQPEDVAAALGISPETLGERLAAAREALLEVRTTRERPATDTKVLADWNGLAIRAFAEGGAALGRPDYIAAAAETADFVLDALTLDDGLAHTWKDGRAAVPAFQEDYAALAGACLSLYEATFTLRWLDRGRALLDDMREQFGDPNGPGFFRTGPRHEQLITRQKDLVDASVPSGNGLAADALLRLAGLTGERALVADAVGILQLAHDFLERAPSALGTVLCALDDYLAGRREIAILGPEDAPPREALLAVVRARYLPGSVIAVAAPGEPATERVPLLADRGLQDGQPTAFVCRGHVCQVPTTDPEALAAQLEAGVAG